MSRRFTQIRKRFCAGRRVLCAALALLYITIASGVPAPIGRPLGKGGELFPCSTCGCGCATAEQCWRSCCCHTLAERMEWARKHGVRPPDHAIVKAQAEGLDLAWLGIPSLPSCCNQIAKNSLPPSCQKRAAATCCNSARSCCDRSNEPHDGSKGGRDHVIAWRALACHGQSLNWLSATLTLVAERPTVSLELPIVTWLGPASSDSPDSIAPSPEVPPPELA
jgi:hypothetical protein